MTSTPARSIVPSELGARTGAVAEEGSALPRCSACSARIAPRLARVLEPGVQQPAGPAQVGADPPVLIGMGEEEVLLVTVLEPRERRGEADHHLLDPSGEPAPEAGVEADAQRRHQRFRGSVMPLRGGSGAGMTPEQ